MPNSSLPLFTVKLDLGSSASCLSVFTWQIVPLDCSDRTDRSAGRIDDLHADGGSRLRKGGDCGRSQN